MRPRRSGRTADLDMRTELPTRAGLPRTDARTERHQLMAAGRARSAVMIHRARLSRW